MCRSSHIAELHAFATRPARVGDRVVSARLGRRRIDFFDAFVDPAALSVVVCMGPGTQVRMRTPTSLREAYGLRECEVVTVEARCWYDVLQLSDGVVIGISRLGLSVELEVVALPIKTTLHAMPRHDGEQLAARQVLAVA